MKKALRKACSFFKRNINKFTFVMLHVLVLSVLFVPITPGAIWLFVGFYFVRMFGITAGYHRLFSHASYKANRLVQFILAWIGCSAMQKGPLFWAAEHREHHLHSDTDKDPHSPLAYGFWRGFYWAHIGWVLSQREGERDLSGVRDLSKFWELRLLERFHLIPGLCLLYLCWRLEGASGMAWGFVASTVLLYHGTFTVNSVCHLFGKQRFKTGDQSRDNWFIAIFVTLGEGWHNLHHARPARTKHGYYWWELDFTYYPLWALEKIRLVRDLYKPPPPMPVSVQTVP